MVSDQLFNVQKCSFHLFSFCHFCSIITSLVHVIFFTLKLHHFLCLMTRLTLDSKWKMFKLHIGHWSTVILWCFQSNDVKTQQTNKTCTISFYFNWVSEKKLLHNILKQIEINELLILLVDFITDWVGLLWIFFMHQEILSYATKQIFTNPCPFRIKK